MAAVLKQKIHNHTWGWGLRPHHKPTDLPSLSPSNFPFFFSLLHTLLLFLHHLRGVLECGGWLLFWSYPFSLSAFLFFLSVSGHAMCFHAFISLSNTPKFNISSNHLTSSISWLQKRKYAYSCICCFPVELCQLSLPYISGCLHGTSWRMGLIRIKILHRLTHSWLPIQVDKIW